MSAKPDRDRRRSRSRSRPRKDTASSLRQRSPPRGPRTERDRPPQDAPPKARGPPEQRNGETQPEPKAPAAVNGDGMDVDEDEDEDEAMMRKIMGFSKFRSTQNTKVPGNNVYGVRKEKKTEYRQYMNRVGGFNRPLSPSR